MNILIRQEKKHDFKTVLNLVELAFETVKISDHKEYLLVERLRKSNTFVPELSLIAECNNEIIGYILLTEIKIKRTYLLL